MTGFKGNINKDEDSYLNLSVTTPLFFLFSLSKQPRTTIYIQTKIYAFLHPPTRIHIRDVDLHRPATRGRRPVELSNSGARIYISA